MIIRDTQKLFWKQWPIKIVIRANVSRSHANLNVARFELKKPYFLDLEDRQKKLREVGEIIKVVKKEVPAAGVRREGNVSVFVSTEKELEKILGLYSHRIVEVWKPKNDKAKRLLFEHTADVVRERPWYGRFKIRARILYTSHLKNEIENFKAAVNSLEQNSWHAAGLLMNILKSVNSINSYAWGQPLYLYLSSNDDAALLKLQCGTVIERFERIRAP